MLNQYSCIAVLTIVQYYGIHTLVAYTEGEKHTQHTKAVSSMQKLLVCCFCFHHLMNSRNNLQWFRVSMCMYCTRCLCVFVFYLAAYFLHFRTSFGRHFFSLLLLSYSLYAVFLYIYIDYCHYCFILFSLPHFPLHSYPTR